MTGLINKQHHFLHIVLNNVTFDVSKIIFYIDLTPIFFQARFQNIFSKIRMGTIDIE